MRLSTLLFGILLIAIVMGLSRDEVGRVAVIVFFSGVALIVAGLGAIMALFQTLGAFGEARGLAAHLEAMVATVLVLLFGSSAMLGVIFVGALLVQWAIP